MARLPLRASENQCLSHPAVLGVRAPAPAGKNAQYAETVTKRSSSTAGTRSHSRTSPSITSKRLERLNSGLNGIPRCFAASATQVLCLCLALSMGPSSSQRCAAQIEKQRKIALSYHRRLTPRDIQESAGLAVFRRPNGPRVAPEHAGRAAKGSQWVWQGANFQ